MTVPEDSPDADPAVPESLPEDRSAEAVPSSLPETVPPQGRGGPARPARVALAVAGLLAVTATSTAVTVAVGRPEDRPRAVAAAPAATPSATATPSPSPSPSPSPTVAPSTPPPAPKPSSTLHGTVSGDRHGGDLRFFLVPMPDGAESYGSSDGAKLSTDELSAEFGNSDEIPRILKSYGYQDDAAERRYRTADGKQEVSVRMLRFKNGDMAREFAKGMSFDSGDSFDIDGDSGAKGVLMKPEQEAWTGKLVGVSSVGDVEYQVSVYVKGTPDKALLADAMRRQRERLGSGG
ncbi:hypothetical protein [Kitasatospora sp. NPDC088346]|uniref:hypothetical protein n=1 Tax=Kitasatospora sp. NPDC088346 TaxID=3364073 RepID=UPI00381D8450